MIKKLTATRKTLIALLAAVCLIFLTIGMVSLFYDGTAALTANAETSGDYTELNSESENLTSLTTGNYKLTSGISVTSSITLAESADVTIDLNGYTISASECNTVTVAEGCTLTIKDSSAKGSGTIANESTGAYYAIENNGTLNITGGTMTAVKAVYQNSGALTMTGGTVSGTNKNVENATTWPCGIRVNSGTADISGGTVSVYVSYQTSSAVGYAIYSVGNVTLSGDAAIVAAAADKQSQVGGVYMSQNGQNSLTINDNVTVTAKFESTETGKYGAGGIYIFGNGDNTKAPNLTINSGYIYGDTYGICGNGTQPSSTSTTDYRYTTIVINDGTIIGGATGIYHPQTGDLTVNGGSITGLNSAIEIRSGSLTITGGTFTATYEGDDAGATANSSGTTVVGAAIGISQHTTENELTVVITGGTFDGIYAVYESDTVKSSTATDKGEISATITGGTFNGSVASTTSTTTGEEGETTTYALTITGGTYSDTTASTYTAEGVTLPTEAAEDGTYSVTLDTSVEYGENDNVLMSIGGTVSAYESFSAALEAAETAGITTLSIWLNDDITECITIPAGYNVTLDLCGYTITNKVTETTTDGVTKYSSTHTIVVKAGAYLTIKDSSSGGTGTVDNVTHGCGAIQNYGTTILNGGIYTRSQEAGDAKTSDGGNSWYTIDNQGTMIIYDGVAVTTRLWDEENGKQVGTYSSLIRNGDTTVTDINLIIYGGTFTGGLNTIKNGGYGSLSISGGAFTNTYQDVIMNWNVATITGGTFVVTGSGSAVIWLGTWDDSTNPAVTISGGTFTAENEDALVIATPETMTYKGDVYTIGYESAVTITAGTFNGTIDLDTAATTEITGGSYDETAYVSISQYVTANTDLSYDEDTGKYVATVYDVKVTGLAGVNGFNDSDDDGSALAQALAAIADAATGEYTITLGSSYTYDSAITISSGYSVTLDLNGYTLTVNGSAVAYTNSSKDYYSGLINYGTLIIVDGIGNGELVLSNDSLNYGIYNYGEITVKSGTLSAANSGSTSFVIYNASGAYVTVTGGTISGESRSISSVGTVVIEGGTLECTSSSAIGIFSSGSLTISDGIISTNYIGVYVGGGTAEISGGTIYGGTWGAYASSGTLTVSGGDISGKYGLQSHTTTYITGGTITGNTLYAVVSYGTDANVIIGVAGGNNDDIKLIGTASEDSRAVNIIYGGTVYLYSGTLTGYTGIGVFGENESTYSTLYVYGGIIEAQSFAIFNNGSEESYHDSAKTQIYYPGYTKMYIYGGTITSTEAAAMYLPGTNGETYIYGGTITGYDTAVEIRAGSLTITDGVFTATATEFKWSGNGNGSTISGAAIAVSQHTTEKELTISITGGTFNGIYAVYETDTVDRDEDDEDEPGEISVTLTGGTFNGNVASTTSTTTGEDEEETTTYALTITGGTYTGITDTDDFANYLADGLATTSGTVNADGTVTYGITIDNSSSATANYVGVYINGGNVVAFENLSSALEYIYGTEDGQANIDTTNDYSIVIYVYDNYTETADIEFKLGYEVTLNLNGYTLTVESGVTFANSGTLTITNLTGSGSIVLNNTNGIENYGTLYIGGYTVNGTTAVTAAGGTVEINGTAISGAVIVTGGTVNVYDGYITGGVTAEGGAIYINSGYVYGTVTATDGTIVIYGGVILSETTDSAYFEDGYYAYLQGDGTYLVALGVYVAIPEVEEAYTYTGKEPDHGIAANDYYSITLSAYTVGIQTITLSLADGCVWADGTTADRVIYIYVAPAAITVDLPETTDYIYSTAVSVDGITAESADGTEVTIAYGLTEGTYDLADLTSINTIGSYTIYYKVTAVYHAAAEGSFTVTIAKRQITAPEADDSTYTYTGKEITYILATSDYYTISGNVQTTAGTYTVTVSLKDTTDCEWSDGTTADKTYTFVIAKYTVEIPEADGTTYTYDGSKLTYALEESDYYTIEGGEQTDAGTYTVTVVLNNVVNTEWSDGTKTAKQYSFVIKEAELTVSASGYSGSYDGKSHGVTVTAATVNGTAAVIVYSESLGGDYTATAPEKTDAGTYVIYYVVTAANHTAAAGYVTIEITAVSASTSENSSISGDVTSDTFVVEDITVEMSVVEEEDYEIAAETIVSTVVEAVEEVTGGEVVAVYDVTLTTSSGEITVSEATDGGSVTVKTAIPTALIGRGFYIVHIHDGEVIGILTSDDYTVANGYVSFEVSSLSQFAFVATSEEAQGTEGNTGSTDGAAADSSITTGDIVTICVLVGGTVAIVLLLAVAVWAISSRKRRS